uniref:Uncharacterized protein n=1 Tax=Globodera rostochiensis TaxID=31243 RepID=A0A914H3C2_GLORO
MSEKNGGQSRSSRPEVLFPVGRVHRLLREEANTPIVGWELLPLSIWLGCCSTSWLKCSIWSARRVAAHP